MTIYRSRTATSYSISSWTEERALAPADRPSGTDITPDRDVVLLQGHVVPAEGGMQLLSVRLDPGVIAKKLAIRKLNDRLSGKTAKSNTF